MLNLSLITLLLVSSPSFAGPPSRVAFCESLLRRLNDAPDRPVPGEVRELRRVLTHVYPPRRPLDPSDEESEVTLDLARVLRRWSPGDAHARAVVRLRAIENTLSAPGADAHARASVWRGPEIAAVLTAMDEDLARIDLKLGLGGQIARRLRLGEAISAGLCGGPVVAIGACTDLATAAVAALTFAPTYLMMRRFARHEITDRSQVRGWPAQRRIIAGHLARGGPAFSMIGGSIAVRLPLLRAIAAEQSPGPAHDVQLRDLAAEPNDFTPGPARERVRFFFDSIFFTDPDTGEPVWLMIARAFEQWTRDDFEVPSPTRVRRGVALF